MRHARHDYNRIQDPAGIIPENEPVFLLRAQDVASAATVRSWAALAKAHGADEDIVSIALEHADRMEAWPNQKVPDLRDPVKD